MAGSIRKACDLDWLGEKRDWPVGRQLWWGHRIPIWSKAVEEKAELEGLLAKLQTDADVAAGQVAYQVEVPPEAFLAILKTDPN